MKRFAHTYKFFNQDIKNFILLFEKDVYEFGSMDD